MLSIYCNLSLLTPSIGKYRVGLKSGAEDEERSVYGREDQRVDPTELLNQAEWKEWTKLGRIDT